MIKKYLLDTNIISEFCREKPNQKVVECFKARKDLCAISAITWEEMNYGIKKLPEGKRKNYLIECIKLYKETFEILPYTDFAAEITGKIKADSEKSGKKLPGYDSQIAGTAISNAMILVTRNTKDFEPIKDKTFLQVENWFE